MFFQLAGFVFCLFVCFRLISMSNYFVKGTHSFWASESYLKSQEHIREGSPTKANEILKVCIPLKVWVCKIIKCICMRCWQASLWGGKTQETSQLFNFWNTFLYMSYWSCLCKFLKLHSHKTKLGTVSRKGAFWIHQSGNKPIWKTDLRKGQMGSSRNTLKALTWIPVSIWKLIYCWLPQTCISHDSCSFYPL